MTSWKAARQAGSAAPQQGAAHAAAAGSARGWRARARRVITRLLAVGLFRKIVVANASMIVLVAGAVAFAAARVSGPASWEVAAGLIVLGVAGTVVVNAVVVSLALRPLRLLHEAAARVQAGDLGARASGSPLADRDLERVVDTFNAMLDHAAMNRARLRDIAARAQSAAEEERKRLARELHDGIAQTLAALRVRLRVARATRDPDAREIQLDQIAADVGEAIEEVRRMARGLRPPSLDMLGLQVAIDSYARPLAEAAGLEIETRLASTTGLLGTDAELALYRILQEALSNVVRHSGASQVIIELRRSGADIELSVTDDGRGFRLADATAQPGGGLGLFGMQERAAYVGGSVQIQSESGRGTQVLVKLPITEATRNYA